jgi:hypothetical protein
MDEAGLCFCATRAPVGKLFRVVTKQEFDCVGVVLPGSALAPSQIAFLNLMTGAVDIKSLHGLATQGQVSALGFRRLVKVADAKLNRVREANLRLAFQRLSLPEPPSEEASRETVGLLLGEKTKATAKLRQFVDELEIPPIGGKICLRVLEELNEEARAAPERAAREARAPESAVLAALFKSWFCGGEIADLLTTLTIGQSRDFQPLYLQLIRPPANSGAEPPSQPPAPAPATAPPSAPQPAHDPRAGPLAQPLSEAQAAFGPAAASGFDARATPTMAIVCELLARAASDAAIAARLAANRPPEPTLPARLASCVASWVSGVARSLLLPELPVIDLAPLLLLADLQMPQHATRSCLVTTRPTDRLCLGGDVILDRAGFGLHFLTRPELEQLDQELSRSSAPEDQRLRTLVQRELAS